MRTPLLALALVAVTLAGCSDGGSDGDTDDGDFDEYIDEGPSEDTGIIRGVVVTPAIVPIPDVTVTLANDPTRSVQTNANGNFGFDSLAPGTYILKLAKPGYVSVQSSAVVVAGDARPPIVKVQMEIDEEQLPYVQHFPFTGHLACSVSTTGGRLNHCSIVLEEAGIENRNYVEIETEGTPDFVQAEMEWKATQTVGEGLYLSLFDGESFSPMEVEGASPLVLQANRTNLENGTGTWKPGGSTMLEPGKKIAFVVFSGTHPALYPPVCPADAGIQDFKCWGNGVTIDQSFTLITSVFYRITPPEDYRFLEHGVFEP